MNSSEVLVEDISIPWFEPQAIFVNIPYLSRLRKAFSTRRYKYLSNVSPGFQNQSRSIVEINQVGQYLTVTIQLLSNPNFPDAFKPDENQCELMAKQVKHIATIWSQFNRVLSGGEECICGDDIVKNTKFEFFPEYGECIISVDSAELLKSPRVQTVRGEVSELVN